MPFTLLIPTIYYILNLHTYICTYICTYVRWNITIRSNVANLLPDCHWIASARASDWTSLRKCEKLSRTIILYTYYIGYVSCVYAYASTYIYMYTQCTSRIWGIINRKILISEKIFKRNSCGKQSNL